MLKKLLKVSVIDVKPYASNMECLVPLIEKFNHIYGHYPKYPVADAGYSSYNHYLYCAEYGMKKYMKFTMYKKKTTDKKYYENSYRIVKDENGNLICPNGGKNESQYSIRRYGWNFKME